MSNKTKASGARRRHVPQHRKEPPWQAGPPSLPSGLGTKIVFAGVAGATLALPATSALASPSSIALNPGSRTINIRQAADVQSAFSAHAVAAPASKAPKALSNVRFKPPLIVEDAGLQFHPPHIVKGPGPRFRPPHIVNERHGAAREHHGLWEEKGIPVSGVTASATAPQGPGLLLEPNGTFVTLPPSASNVHTVPAGSLIITPGGAMVSPPVGTYFTIYGLITVTPAPDSATPPTGAPPSGTSSSGTSSTGTSSTGTSATGTTVTGTLAPIAASVNPGGPLQSLPPQSQPNLPQPVQAQPDQPQAAQAPLAAAPTVAAPKAAPPGIAARPPAPTPPTVQVTSAMGGVTISDNGTVTPTGTVNLAFPGPGIGAACLCRCPRSARPSRFSPPSRHPTRTPCSPIRPSRA